ncbi:SDR family NAD(P)-dependent oxidoreductase, partial [Acinetobacter baumannii]
EAGLAKTVELLAPYSVKVTTQKVDVAKRDEVATWAKAVVNEHGQVNLIFNNAGVAIGSTAEGVSYEDLEWLIGINFWGVVYG